MSNEFIRLRFVRTSGLDSALIAYREDTCMPFVPSHVEAVIDGKYVGQHLIGGMLARDPGYDKSTLEHELFIDLPCDGDRAGAAVRWRAAARTRSDAGVGRETETGAARMACDPYGQPASSS